MHLVTRTHQNQDLKLLILHHHRLIIFCLLYRPLHLEMPDAMWAPSVRCCIRLVQQFSFNAADLAMQGWWLLWDQCFAQLSMIQSFFWKMDVTIIHIATFFHNLFLPYIAACSSQKAPIFITSLETNLYYTFIDIRTWWPHKQYCWSNPLVMRGQNNTFRWHNQRFYMKWPFHDLRMVKN